ncbi:MAG: porin [Planctomycetota bacterium]|nr:porin [Planctomycetota bacterium]
MKIPIGALAIGLCCSTVLAGPVVDTMSDQDLRDMVFKLKSEVDTLRSEQDTNWLTEQRAEQIRGLVSDVLADADTRATLQGTGMTSGYDQGFFIGSSDGNWLMKINGELQVRWHYNDASAQSDVHGFEIRRSKLKISGHVVDPSWDYKLTVVSNRQRGLDTPANVFIEDAYINKTFDNGMYIRIGQFKAPFLREMLVSSSNQLAVERSIINNAFTWGRSEGIMVGYAEDTWKIDAMYNNGPNDQNTQVAGSPATNGIAARAEILLGSESDWGLFRGLNARNTGGKTGFMIGAAVGWFNGNQDGIQEYGNGDVARSVAFTVDGSIAGDGWTVLSYFVYADGKNRYLSTVNFPNRETDQGSLGVVVQGGYLLQDDLELIARYSYGDIEGANYGTVNQPGNFFGAGDNLSVMTIGANWFINSNVKFSMDWGYAFDTVTDGGGDGSVPQTVPTSADYTSSGTGWRADNNGNADGQWLLRAQMQLVF